jgi:hypothetical protein
MALGIRYANPGLPVEYELDSDPTMFTGWGGTNAEAGSILYRTDLPSIYRKTGPNPTDWTIQASASSTGGVSLQDEGAPVPGNPHSTLNFVGTGVTATDAGGGVASIAVPGNTIQDEGAPIAGNPHPTLNFVGTGVTAADAGGGVASITVPGNTIQDEGAPIAGNPHPTLNFVGTGVTVTDTGGGVATITIPGGVNGITVQNLGAPLPGLFTILNFLNGVFGTDAGGGIANIAMAPVPAQPARALDTPFQPSLTRPTLCIYTVEIAVGIGNGNPSGNGSVDLCSDPFNPPTTKRCAVVNDITGQMEFPGDFIVLRPTGILVFLVPATWWVSMETASTGGGPSFALTSVSEIVL